MNVVKRWTLVAFLVHIDLIGWWSLRAVNALRIRRLTPPTIEPAGPGDVAIVYALLLGLVACVLWRFRELRAQSRGPRLLLSVLVLLLVARGIGLTWDYWRTPRDLVRTIKSATAVQQMDERVRSIVRLSGRLPQTGAGEAQVSAILRDGWGFPIQYEAAADGSSFRVWAIGAPGRVTTNGAFGMPLSITRRLPE